ncbi:hypothetical protein ACFFUR_05175 [Echinicola jeungdonensis]|uniref:Uncharacterized protein n=1 Tax=Echinicola jeungdonensis TaxID=709343 RepID=A0ABV5J4G1_9BACT
MNYNNKKFQPITVSENGQVSNQTLFTYHQNGNLLTSTYQGENIVLGHHIGTVDEKGVIDMRYHQVDKKRENHYWEMKIHPRKITLRKNQAS